MSETHSEVRFLADQELLENIDKLKGLLAHSNPRMSTADLIGHIAKIALEQLDPGRKKAVNSPLPTQKPTKTRWIPSAIRRSVWQRAGSKCTFVDPKTGRKCDSTYALQIDHIRPWALGGDHSPQNLRILCFQHNQHAGLEIFGQEKMRSARENK